MTNNIIDLRNLPNLTIERQILINEFYKKFDINAVAGTNKKIVNVAPISFFDIVGANEFTVYSPNKMYIGLDIIFTRDITIEYANITNVNFQNENNVSFLFVSNAIPIMNVTEFYVNNPVILKDLIFSRFSTTYIYFKFLGYRITLI